MTNTMTTHDLESLGVPKPPRFGEAMTQYRLMPVIPTMWVVQEKGWFFWRDCTEGITQHVREGLFGGDTFSFDTLYVHSIKDGLDKIKELQDRDIRMGIANKEQSKFDRNKKPIVP